MSVIVPNNLYPNGIHQYLVVDPKGLLNAWVKGSLCLFCDASIIVSSYKLDNPGYFSSKLCGFLFPLPEIQFTFYLCTITDFLKNARIFDM